MKIPASSTPVTGATPDPAVEPATLPTAHTGPTPVSEQAASSLAIKPRARALRPVSAKSRPRGMLPSSAPAMPAQPLLTRPLVVDATSSIALIQRVVPVERRAALLASKAAVAEQLADGPVILGEDHTRADARALLIDLMQEGKVKELFLELGSVKVTDLGLPPPAGSAHDRNASDHLREHTGADPAGDPVWASFSESLNWIDIHRNALPLANLIEAAQKAGVAVFFYDNDAGRDRTSSTALGRRNLVAGQEFMRSAREAHSGSALLVGRDHLDPEHCGGAEMTIQHACKVDAARVHDLS